MVPLVLHSPQKWLLYSLEGAVGTCIGGAICYGIARVLGQKMLYNIAPKEAVGHGQELVDPYWPVSFTHLPAHETRPYLVCRLFLVKKKK